MRRDERTLMREVDELLTSVWPAVMRDWQAQLKTGEPGAGSIALITRDCGGCGTRVRVGALMTVESPQRPPGDRAYCATCRRVTCSPVVAVHGLVIDDDGEEDGEVGDGDASS